MRTLIIGDTHIDDQYIDELREVFEEIFTHKADAVIHLGDYYNSCVPSPKSLAFGTEMAKKLMDTYGSVTILDGNGRHNWKNKYSVIGYLKYLGVKIVGMELAKKFDGTKCFFGHYMTNESYKEYGHHDYTVKDLQKYDLVLLGHQHIPQDINSKIYHVGSAIYQHFNEVKDPHKRIAMIDNGELKFINLKSPIPMKDVTNIKDLQKIDERTKVRLLIPDFHSFKSIVGELSNWKNKFADFKYELKFTKTGNKTKKKESTQMVNYSLAEEIEKIEDVEVKELLKKVFSEIYTGQESKK